MGTTSTSASTVVAPPVAAPTTGHRMQPTIPQSTGGSDMDLPAVQPMDWLFKKERIYLLAQFWQQVSKQMPPLSHGKLAPARSQVGLSPLSRRQCSCVWGALFGCVRAPSFGRFGCVSLRAQLTPFSRPATVPRGPLPVGRSALIWFHLKLIIWPDDDDDDDGSASRQTVAMIMVTLPS